MSTPVLEVTYPVLSSHALHHCIIQADPCESIQLLCPRNIEFVMTCTMTRACSIAVLQPAMPEDSVS